MLEHANLYVACWTTTTAGWTRTVTDDASHLMTLVRSWGITRTWNLYDADDRHIGSIGPSRLVDANGERRGTLDADQILDANRQTLATFRKLTTLKAEVTFAADREANPFLRMLLLAAILVQDASPTA